MSENSSDRYPDDDEPAEDLVRRDPEAPEADALDQAREVAPGERRGAFRGRSTPPTPTSSSRRSRCRSTPTTSADATGNGAPTSGTIHRPNGDAVPGTPSGAYGHWRVLPRFTNKHPPDRIGSPAGARDGRSAVGRRQGPAGRAQRLRRATLAEGLRGLQRDLRRAPDRTRRGRPRVRPQRGLPLPRPGQVSSCPSTRRRSRAASRCSPRCARPPTASPRRGCAGPAVGPAGDLGDSPVTVGRLSECTIPLNDNNVSRRHAEIRPNRQNFVVVDLGSTNGTMVNGTRIYGETALSDGDIISFGSTYVRFEAS